MTITPQQPTSIEELEGLGYIVIPPTDLPAVDVVEEELLATIKGMDQMAFTGGLISRSVPLPSKSALLDNHSVEFEYRRAVAHLAMAKWLEANMPFEARVHELRNELLKGDGLEWWEAKPKQIRKATKQARALLRAGKAWTPTHAVPFAPTRWASAAPATNATTT